MQFYSPYTQTAEVAQKTSWGLIDPVTYLPSIFIDSYNAPIESSKSYPVIGWIPCKIIYFSIIVILCFI